MEHGSPLKAADPRPRKTAAAILRLAP